MILLITTGPMMYAVTLLWKDKSVVFDNNHLPSLLLANVRSIASKLDETELVVSHLGINIIVLTETWLTEFNKNTVCFKGYIPYHRPREKCKLSSGGVSILVSPDMISTKLQITCVYGYHVSQSGYLG